MTDLLTPELLIAVASAAAGYIARLFSSEGKLRNEMQFIKGQLEQLLGMVRSIEDVRVNQAIIERDIGQIQKDVDHAHSKLRVLKDELNVMED